MEGVRSAYPPSVYICDIILCLCLFQIWTLSRISFYESNKLHILLYA